MPPLVPEKIKSSKNKYDSLLEELKVLLSEYSAPAVNIKHDKEIYILLQKLIRYNVPKLSRTQSNTKQYVVVFKDSFISDLWDIIKKLIDELLTRDQILASIKSKQLSDINMVYVTFNHNVHSLEYYTKAFLPKIFNNIESKSFSSLEEYGTIRFFQKVSEIFNSNTTSIFKDFMVEAFEFPKDQQFLILKNLVAYDLPLEQTSGKLLLTDIVHANIKQFVYDRTHFEKVDTLQIHITFYCEKYPILLQSLISNTIDNLLLRFECFETFFDTCMNDPMTIFCILQELGNMIKYYYPWRIEEYKSLVTKTVVKMITEQYFTSFVSFYSSSLSLSDNNLANSLKDFVLVTLNSDIKNIERIAKWICKISEDYDGTSLNKLIKEFCTFLNDVFGSHSKYDKLLWNIYKRKFFLRSVIKTVSLSDYTAKLNQRFDQQVIESKFLDSVHTFEIRQLNEEIVYSLNIKRAPYIVPIILKHDSILDSLDSSDINGLIIPEILNDLLKVQIRFYMELDKNSHKTLSIQNHMNIIELKSPFTFGVSSTPLILLVNLLQASIFCLFNYDVHLSLSDIKAKLTEDKHEIPLIDRNMEMFLEMNVFRKDENDKFYLNKRYKPKKEALNDEKLILYHLPKISSTAIENDKADNKWYKELVGACIIRTLKQRKKCTKTKLFEFVAAEFPGISHGEFKDALEGCKNYYTSENGNIQYIL